MNRPFSGAMFNHQRLFTAPYTWIRWVNVFCLPIGNPLRRIRNWMCLDVLVFLKSKSKCVSRLFSYFVNFGYLRLSKNTRWTFVYVAAVRYVRRPWEHFDCVQHLKVLCHGFWPKPAVQSVEISAAERWHLSIELSIYPSNKCFLTASF